MLLWPGEQKMKILVDFRQLNVNYQLFSVRLNFVEILRELHLFPAMSPTLNHAYLVLRTSKLEGL